MLTGKELGSLLITALPKIGDGRARLLHKLGIKTLFDLIYYLPRRYEDRRIRCLITELPVGESGTASGMITGLETMPLRGKMSILRVTIRDASGMATAVWFNQPFLRKTLRPGLTLTVTGKVERNLFATEIAVSDYEVGSSREMLHTGRIVPIYGATEDLSQRTLRRFLYQQIKTIAPHLRDLLPQAVIANRQLLPLAAAVMGVHFPSDDEHLERARERLVFEELFLYQLGLSHFQKEVQQEGVQRIPKTDLAEQFLGSLPFSLTAGQSRVICEIREDLSSRRRMYRLLQGDVGCGKTVVALYALYYAIASGYQGVLLAPTEVLAEQHHISIRQTAAAMGIRVALFTGSLPKKEREAQLEGLHQGEIDIAVGTHALLEADVQFKNLGLIVIDEQHRFGVQQRDLLLAKGEGVDLLVMTATPIPRSLTLTSYGDLELSVIEDLPASRKTIKSYFLPANEKERVYHFIRKELLSGRQAFVVCPLIEESEKLDLEAAVQRYAELCEEFDDFRVGLLHGRLKIEEKDRIMNAYRQGELQLLVATSVIEVGIDVPNATIMVIEGAERFGLAQLHQLRGRVGRGEYQSYCVLIGNPQSVEARERIKTFVRCSSGFEVAERDLAIRGPGALMGTRQHGISDFRVVDILRDAHLLLLTREAAADWSGELNRELQEEINFRFPTLSYSLKV